MKKILILFTSILILSCNNSNQNKNSVDSIPMTKITGFERHFSRCLRIDEIDREAPMSIT